MTSDLVPYQFPPTGHKIRVVEIDGEPWFVAGDVALALGIKGDVKEIRSDVDHVTARVDGIEQRTGWFTALGFSRIYGLPTDTRTLQRLGKRASSIARRDGITPAKAPNDSFGEVNMYPEACLREAAGLAIA